MSEQKQGARPMSELPMAVRVKLEELLGKSKSALSPGEIDFLFGRRIYLSKEQREDFGLEKMKVALGAVAPEKVKEPKQPEVVVPPATDANTGQTGEQTGGEEDEKLVDHVLTEEDLKLNPELVGQGLKVGDVVQIPADEEEGEGEPVVPPKAPVAPEVNSKSNQRRVAAQKSRVKSNPAKKTNKKARK